MRRKNLVKILKLFSIYVLSQLLYHFDFKNMILWIQRGNVWLVLIFTCRLIIVVFVNLVLWIWRCNVACMISLWEKIYVFHNFPQCASTATISLYLTIFPSCQFSVGMSPDCGCIEGPERLQKKKSRKLWDKFNKCWWWEVNVTKKNQYIPIITSEHC